MQFCESEYNRSMRQYESNLSAAKASQNSGRHDRFQQLEDSLVEEGLESIENYKEMLKGRWKKATCLAEYDGISMGFAIANKAIARIESAQK